MEDAHLRLVLGPPKDLVRAGIRRDVVKAGVVRSAIAKLRIHEPGFDTSRSVRRIGSGLRRIEHRKIRLAGETARRPRARGNIAVTDATDLPTRRLHLADWDVNYRHDVDWVVGAAMLCRRAALEAVRTPAGPFDERFFMYSEELDLCRRLKGEGWRVLYVPEAVVIHYEGKSSEQASAARHIYFNTSKVAYYDKWFGRPWPQLLRRYLLLEFRTQLWIERAKLLLGHKRELRRQRIDAYRQVIASGLSSAR